MTTFCLCPTNLPEEKLKVTNLLEGGDFKAAYYGLCCMVVSNDSYASLQWKEQVVCVGGGITNVKYTL